MTACEPTSRNRDNSSTMNHTSTSAREQALLTCHARGEAGRDHILGDAGIGAQQRASVILGLQGAVDDARRPHPQDSGAVLTLSPVLECRRHFRPFLQLSVILREPVFPFGKYIVAGRCCPLVRRALPVLDQRRGRVVDARARRELAQRPTARQPFLAHLLPEVLCRITFRLCVTATIDCSHGKYDCTLLGCAHAHAEHFRTRPPPVSPKTAIGTRRRDGRRRSERKGHG